MNTKFIFIINGLSVILLTEYSKSEDFFKNNASDYYFNIEGPNSLLVESLSKFILRNSFLLLTLKNRRGQSVQIRLVPDDDIAIGELEELEWNNNKNIYRNICFYHGNPFGRNDVLVNINFCDNMRGTLITLDEEYEFQSTELSNSSRTTGLLHLDLVKSDPKHVRYKCGFSKHDKELQFIREEKDKTYQSKGREERNAESHIANSYYLNNWIRYVETWIVVDYRLYKQFNSNPRQIRQRCHSIVNYANTLLKDLQVHVVLVGLEIWRDRDKIMVTDDYNLLLRDFKGQRKRILKESTNNNHDFTVLLTGINFRGSTVGKAYLGTMCDVDYSSAVVQHFPRNTQVKVIGGTLAHELGHSLGAYHDEHCLLDQDNKDSIMAPSGVKSKSWSVCTKVFIANHIDHMPCLLNVPLTIRNSLQTCGNGIIEHGQQCDCGLDGPCEKCCHTNNCTLKTSAVCGSGECCNLQTCRPFPVTTKCRKEANECDLSEYCIGTTSSCPVNTFKRDGTPCQNGQGRCFEGTCKSRKMLCQSLLNSAANHVASYVTYKKRFDPCVFLMCQPYLNGTSKAFYYNKPRKNWLLKSYLIFEEDKDHSLLNLDGVPCDINKTCQMGVCLPVPSPKSSTCADGCSGHGVCNNFDHCHCDIPFGPPGCNSYGFGGSVQSGHAYIAPDQSFELAIFIFFSVIIAIILIICFCWPSLVRYWYGYKMDKRLERKSPKAGECIEKCCCPCMTHATQWVDNWCPKLEEDYKPVQKEIVTNDLRKTICEVDVNFETPKTELKSWGKASNTLITDMINITPQSTPDTSRKIYLPAKSKSEENLNRPSYVHTVSKDSGCVSDAEEDPDQANFSGSMGSLISMFKSFGRQKSTNSEMTEHKQTTTLKTNNKNAAQKAPLTPSKSGDLRRIVVDPLSNHRISSNRPDFRRSISMDPNPSNNTDSKKVSIHTSEVDPNRHRSVQNVHSIPKANNCGSIKSVIDNFEKANAASTKKPALLPPHIKSKNNTTTTLPTSSAITNESPKTGRQMPRPLLPPNVAFKGSKKN